jgi:phage terminase small subunit
MGRHRLPTHLHVISGAAREHPDRMRKRSEEPVALGELKDQPAPDHLPEDLRGIWNEVRGLLHSNVAGTADAIAFEALVRIIAKIRSGEARAADYARLQGFLAEFGMTPAARSRIAPASMKSDGGFASFHRTMPETR